jgi:hypothetical protein
MKKDIDELGFFLFMEEQERKEKEQQQQEGKAMAQSLRGEPGKSYNQRLRSYLVMQYFLKNADERHVLFI